MGLWYARLWSSTVILSWLGRYVLIRRGRVRVACGFLWCNARARALPQDNQFLPGWVGFLLCECVLPGFSTRAQCIYGCPNTYHH